MRTTKKYFIDKILHDPRQRFYMKRSECAVILEIIMEAIKESILNQQVVELRGIGSIGIKDVGPKSVYDFKDGNTYTKEHILKLKFSPSPVIKEDIKKLNEKLDEESGAKGGTGDENAVQ